MLYYYVELNKLSYQPEVNNTYSINYYVINDQADTVKSGVLKTKNVAGERQAEIGGFNAISLQHGVYYLNLWAKDNASKVTSNVRKKFYVHKPTKSSQSQESETLSEVDTDFSAMDADALKLEFNKASYIAVQQETNIFSQLDSTHAMRKFLTSFWRKRDQGDGVPLGTTRRNYLTMCDAADARFSTPGRTGWKTDLGRVLIMYGNPDEIERYPNSTNAKPYIIWKYYQLDGGSDFIFVDRMGFGDYQLIHSTYYKEIQDPSWQSYIYETGGRGF
jgi:GWxTD domain-containing protein